MKTLHFILKQEIREPRYEVCYEALEDDDGDGVARAELTTDGGDGSHARGVEEAEDHEGEG